MSIIRWERENGLTDVHRRMQSVFENMDRLFGLNAVEQQNALGSFMPRVDISEDKQNLYLHMELPGLKQEDVKLTIADGLLTVRGEKKREQTTNERQYTKIERSYGEFVRQFVLPENIRDEEVEASFADGVLEITIPRAEPEKPAEREVKIQSGKGLRLGNQIKESKSETSHVSEAGKLAQQTNQASAQNKSSVQ